MLQVGGTVRHGRLYIRRPADMELLRHLRARELSHVLAPRQIGKSSLRARTASALRAEGYRCAEVDLSVLGTHGVTFPDWLYSLAHEIATGLDLDEPVAWPDIGTPLQRWADWLGGVVRASPVPIVVFLDELDTVLDLPFPVDDLFSTLRALHNRRVVEPAWERLVFCLLGVASPWGLMRNPWRTPFNVGRSVVLEDFSFAELQGFVPGSPGAPGIPAGALAAVYRWCEGHPFLTQKLGSALEGNPAPDDTAVDEQVRRLFLDASPTPDPGLLAASRVLLEPGPSREERLQLYRRALGGVDLPFDERDPLHVGLVMSGLMARRGAWLRVRNQIVARRFGLDWVAEQQGRTELGTRAWSWVRGGRRDEDLLRGRSLRDIPARVGASPTLTLEESEYLLRSKSAEQHAGATQRLRIALATLGALTLVAAALAAWGRQMAREETLSAAVIDALSAPTLATLPGGQARALASAIAALGPRREGRPLAGAAWGLSLTLGIVRGGVVGNVQGPITLQWCRASRREGWVFVVTGTAMSPRPFDPSRRGSVAASPECAPSTRIGRGAVQASSPDGRSTAYAEKDSPVIQLADRALTGHNDAVASITFSKDGRRLASGAHDDSVRLWDVATGALTWTSLALAGTTAVSFSPDGRWLGAVSEAGEVGLFETRAGPILAELEGPGPEPVYSLALAPSGDELTVGWRGSRLEQWRRVGADWERVPSALPPGCYAAYASRAGRLVTGDGRAAWVDGAVGPFRGRLNTRGVPISPDGTQVVTLVGPPAPDSDPLCGQADDDRVSRTSAAPSPAPDEHAAAILWDVNTGQHRVLAGRHVPIWSAVFSDDGRLATLDSGGEVRVWRTKDGSLLQAIPAGVEQVLGAVFSGEDLFTLGGDDHLRRWEGARMTLDLPTAGDPLAAIPLREDLLTMTRNRNLIRWGGTRALGPGSTPRVVNRFVGPGGALHSLDVTQDGERVLASAGDGTVWVWDASAEPLMKFAAHDGRATFTRFGPDGRWIVSAGADGAVRVLPGDVDTLLNVACRWLGADRSAAPGCRGFEEP